MPWSRRTSPRILLVACLVVGAVGTTLALAVVVTPPLRVLDPRFGIPAIRRPGDAFPVRYEALATPRAPPSAWLQDPWTDARVPLPVTINGTLWTGIYHEVALEVTLPATTLPALYDLHVQWGSRELVEPHAVHVVAGWKPTLALVHFTDTHVFLEEDYTTDQLRQMVREVNLIQPDLVVCTGDSSHRATRAEWELFHEALLGLRVPLVIVLGNHDVGDANVFEELFGRAVFSMDYGPLFHFVGLQTGDKFTNPVHVYPQWDFLRADLAEHQAAAQRVVLAHISPVDGDFEPPAPVPAPNLPFTRAFGDLLTQYEVGLMLVGHRHRDQITTLDGTDVTHFPTPAPLVVQTAAYDHYRLVRVNASHGVIDAIYRGARRWPTGYPPSIPVGHLNYTTPAGGGLEIQNGLNQTFPACRYQFALPATNSSPYQPTRGTVVSTTRGPSAWFVDVQFAVPARANVSLAVVEVPGA